MMQKKVTVCLCTMVLVFRSDSPCSASMIAYSFSGGASTSANEYTYGFEFFVLSDLVVDSLGFFDLGSNGLASSHRVGV